MVDSAEDLRGKLGAVSTSCSPKPVQVSPVQVTTNQQFNVREDCAQCVTVNSNHLFVNLTNFAILLSSSRDVKWRLQMSGKRTNGESVVHLQTKHLKGRIG